MEISSIKRKFLEELNMDIENLSDDFKKFSLSYNREITAEEREFLAYDDYTHEFVLPFKMKDIYGTKHPDYENMTFFDAFLKSKRGDENLKKYYHNKSYYTETLKQKDQSKAPHDTPLELNRLSNGKCFVTGGNNRISILMMMYLSEISQATTDEKKNEIDEKYTFYGTIRSLPQDRDVISTIFILKNLKSGSIKFKFKGKNPDDCKYEIIIEDKKYEIKSVDDLKELVFKAYNIENLDSSEKLYDKVYQIVTDYISYNYSQGKLKILNEICPNIQLVVRKFKELRTLTNGSSSIFDNIDLTKVNYLTLVSILDSLIKEEKIKKIKTIFTSCKTKKELLDNILTSNQLAMEIEVYINDILPNFSDFTKFIKEIEDLIPDSFNDETNYETLFQEIVEIYITKKENDLKALKEKETSYKSIIEQTSIEYMILVNSKKFKDIFERNKQLNSEFESLESALKNKNSKLEELNTNRNAMVDEKTAIENKNPIIRFAKRKDLSSLTEEIEIYNQEITSITQTITILKIKITELKNRITENKKRILNEFGLELSIDECTNTLDNLLTNNITPEYLKSKTLLNEKKIEELCIPFYEKKLHSVIEKYGKKKPKTL